MPCYHLTFPSVIESEKEALDRVEAILSDNDLEPRLRHRVMMAFSEAFTNALVHGNARLPEKTIRVRFEINENSVTADITDEGHGGLERIRHITPPGPMAEGGRGVALIRHYADELTFEESEFGGLRVSVLIRRKTEVRTQ